MTNEKAEAVALAWLRNHEHKITDNRPVNQDWLFLCLLSSLDRRLLQLELLLAHTETEEKP